VPAIATTSGYAYGRFAVTDNLCGLSFAATDAFLKPQALGGLALAQIYGAGSGIPPTGTVAIVNDNAVGGAALDSGSVTRSTGDQDFNVDGAICLRNLWTGTEANAARVREGVKATLRSANPHGKPAIIVAGRADALVPVNFNARPYFGENRMVEGARSRLSYIEITNAQHFDASMATAALAGYSSVFVPLHYYFVQAMDRMWAHLTQRAPLPPSQVVRTTPRGGAPNRAPAITTASVPPIALDPAPADRITFARNVVTIPD
jgi:hydroxybutyrate-dimer hydrolase